MLRYYMNLCGAAFIRVYEARRWTLANTTFHDKTLAMHAGQLFLLLIYLSIFKI